MKQEEFAATYGYSNAVHAAGLMFVAGQVGIREDGTTPSDPAEQYALAFSMLEQVLVTEGSSKEDLVELVSFHCNYPTHMDLFMQAKADFLGNACPTWTAIGVAALGAPETLVEIKATARSHRTE
jgi:enamine deaminase RidA (YjgF/YER057c/UK114 family)